MSRLILLAILLGLTACQGTDRQEHRVRHPQLDALDEQVRRTLENAHRLWRERIGQAAEPADRASAYAQLGQTYLAHHFDEAAADALDYATTHNSGDWRWHFYYARALEQSHRLHEAGDALSRALELHSDAEVRFLRAQVRARQGDVIGALSDLRTLKQRARDTDDATGTAEETTETPVLEASWLALEAKLLAGQRRLCRSGRASFAGARTGA